MPVQKQISKLCNRICFPVVLPLVLPFVFVLCLLIGGAIAVTAAPSGSKPASASSAPAPTAQAAPAAPVANDKRSQAILLYNAKDYRGAAQMLDDYLTVNSRDPYAAYYAAMANQQIGNSNKARIYYRQVYTLAPSSQIGGFAKNVLLKLDPSFASTLTPVAASTGVPAKSAPGDNPFDLPTTDSAEIDPSLPAECRIRYEKGLGTIPLDCYINGHPIKMQFDTGAPNVVIGKNQLAQIGMPAPLGKADGFTGGSSNGGFVSVWYIKATIKAGALERKDVNVQVLEYNAAPPLLGQTFFKGFDYTIDNGAGEIVIRQKALSKKLGSIRNSLSVPFTFREKGNRVIVQVEVNGKSGPMIFDTGNTASACTFRSFGEAESFGVKVPDDAVRWRHSGVTGSGNSLHFPVKRMKLGPIDRSDVEVGVNEGMEDPEGLPLLGQPFWQAYEYTIDMDNKLIHFVRR